MLKVQFKVLNWNFIGSQRTPSLFKTLTCTTRCHKSPPTPSGMQIVRHVRENSRVTDPNLVGLSPSEERGSGIIRCRDRFGGVVSESRGRRDSLFLLFLLRGFSFSVFLAECLVSWWFKEVPVAVGTVGFNSPFFFCPPTLQIKAVCDVELHFSRYFPWRAMLL